MSHVTLGPRWVWPRECACCLATADATLDVKTSRGVFLVVAAYERVLTVKVPYCAPCRTHARRYDAARVGGLLLPAVMALFGGFVVGMIGLAVAGDASNRMVGAMLIGVPSLTTVGFVAFRVWQRASIDLGPRHAAAGAAVAIAGWAGEMVELSCASPEFQARLEAVNGLRGRGQGRPSKIV